MGRQDQTQRARGEGGGAGAGCVCVCVDVAGAGRVCPRVRPHLSSSSPPSACSMAPLFLPLLAALALARVPEASADAVERDSSGKQHPQRHRPVVGSSLS